MKCDDVCADSLFTMIDQCKPVSYATLLGDRSPCAGAACKNDDLGSAPLCCTATNYHQTQDAAADLRILVVSNDQSPEVPRSSCRAARHA